MGVEYLSHLLSNQTPGYGGEKSFVSEADKKICDGCSANTSRWSLSNHIGTHIDLPFHFSDQGQKMDAYGAEFWIFNTPQLIDRPSELGDTISVESWCEEIGDNTDLLLLRTGIENYRGKDEFWSHNPGFSPELGEWLREKRPSLRAIGFDSISLTGYQNRELGRTAHRSFLSPEFKGSPIVIIEDMALAALKKSPNKVTVSPLRVEGADGSPVTILGET